MEAKLFVEFTALPAGGYSVKPALYDPSSDKFVEEEKLHACRTDIREVGRFIDGVLASWASEVDELRRRQAVEDADNVTRIENHRPGLLKRMFG
ncbi:MAG: hypothetical protein K0U61_02615 [Alphaproteobacteria bacterium]|nr:hypothetical protein [Alphaproteobacteria bacterium]